MSKQTKPITQKCQHRSQCDRDAVVGVHAWAHGETDVNLDKPVRVFCGRHKPRLDRNVTVRNVRIVNG